MSQPHLPPPASPADDRFRFGYRPTRIEHPDGTEEWTRVPLTLDDVLHPQLGDVIPTSIQHVKDCFYLYGIFESRLKRVENGLVLSDCLINWGRKDMRNHAPDVSVFSNLSFQPSSACGLFHLKEHNAKCLFLIELVSPNTRENDVVHKKQHYHLLGIPLYIIVDWEKEDRPRTIRGFRYEQDGWVDITVNEQVVIERFGVALAVREGRTVAIDLQTGEVQLDFLAQSERIQEMLAELESADEKQATLEQTYELELDLRRAAQEAARQAVVECKQAQKQVKAAEKQAKDAAKQAKAAANERQQAEKRAQLAEDRVKAEADERKKAEERATKVEEQMQALLAELQRLRGKPA
jgi:Uma2 family endonuclease